MGYSHVLVWNASRCRDLGRRCTYGVRSIWCIQLLHLHGGSLRQGKQRRFSVGFAAQTVQCVYGKGLPLVEVGRFVICGDMEAAGRGNAKVRFEIENPNFIYKTFLR